jgi:zinc protease
MLTRGTERRTSLEFAAALEDVGASLSAGADALSTSITGGGLTRDFDLVVELLAEMLRRPAFPGADLDRLKGQALAAIVQARTSPERVASRAFERLVYPPGHPLRPETLEESERAIGLITRDDLLAFHQRQYGPDRMIVVVTGDVDAQRVREALERRLGDWPHNPKAQPVAPPDLSLQLAPATSEIRIDDKSQTAIVWGHAGGLRRSDPDFYAAQVLNLVLGGGGLTSRLSTAIRDEQGLAYSVYSYFDANLYPGVFQVGLGTNPANAKKAIAALEVEIRRVLRDGVTQREIDEAVAYLTGRFPLRLETNGGVAEILWAMEFYNLGTDYIDRYAAFYRAVTLAQVNEAAKQHLHPDRATLSVAGPLP